LCRKKDNPHIHRQTLGLMRICGLSFSHAASADDRPLPRKGESSARFHLRQLNNEKRKLQDPVKVPILHSHERVVRLPIV